MSAGLPRGAPLSAHFASVAISSSLSDGSLWNFWIPMFFSTYHGGITPAFGPMPVRCLIARAHGPDVLVGDERHRRDAVRAVAVLAAALKDRRDVLGEVDVRLRLGGCQSSGYARGRRPVAAALTWSERVRSCRELLWALYSNGSGGATVVSRSTGRVRPDHRLSRA